MNIGKVAERCGLPAKTIRYYEDIGLVTPDREANGYRDYSVADSEKLRFLQRARSLGFSIEGCRTLLSLYEDRDRASANVKVVARAHLLTISRKIRELESMQAALIRLVKSCHGDERPDCPILDDLAGMRDVTETA
ncbi:MAG TPA: Cu(I)-responsive transcriptional regulator [Rhodobacteraceae bacterium]|nr:Cu(I)-responsive transcriptional regulator [Paracoccaceae bacterium]